MELIILRRNKYYAGHRTVKKDKKINCCCGGHYTLKSKYRHLKSLLHKQYYNDLHY